MKRHSEKQNSGGVLRGLVQASSGKFDYGLHLLAVEPIEPFHDVFDIGAASDQNAALMPVSRWEVENRSRQHCFHFESAWEFITAKRG